MHRPPLRLNCCIACLERGVYAVETLFHVTFVCLAYADLHQAGVIKDITSRFDPKAFCLHRDMWTWRQLKALRHFFVHICDRRLCFMGGRGHTAAHNAQSRADYLWERRFA